MKRWKILLLLVALAAVCVWYGSRIQHSSYTVRSDDLPEAFRGFRVVEIADLHGKAFGENSETLVNMVREAEPDLIAIDGDLFDERTDLSMLEPLLPALCEIAPTFYVTGNHEWATSHVLQTLAWMQELGVTVLGNDYVTLMRDGQRIAVAGVHDPNGPYDMKTKQELVAEIRADLGQDTYILMLAHRNGQLQEWAELGVQTVLTGHGHGGLIRLPFVGGLIGVDGTLFPTYDAGLFRQDETSMIVSRGLSNSVLIPRILNPPDLPVITLEREN